MNKNDEEDYKINYKGNILRFINQLNLHERMRWLCNRINQYEENSEVLEIGCSNALLGHILINKLTINDIDINTKCYKYTGIDYIKESLSEAKDALIGCTFILHDAMKLNKKLIGKYDIVVISQVLEHITDGYKQVVEHAYKYLKHGGMLLITVPVENTIPSKAHITKFDFYTLTDMMEGISDNYKIMRMEKFTKSTIINIFGLICYKGDEYGRGRTFDR